MRERDVSGVPHSAYLWQMLGGRNGRVKFLRVDELGGINVIGQLAFLGQKRIDERNPTLGGTMTNPYLADGTCRMV
jgi:hypothetical protein